MLSRRLIPSLLLVVRPSANLTQTHLANANVISNSVSSLRPHGLPRLRLRPAVAAGAGAVRYNSTTPSTGKRPVDAKVEDLSELYASAKDEFEIAVEETSKNTIYARDDRETAREEFEKFKQAYEDAVATSSEEDGLEIRRRVGQRLREMESAMETLSQADMEEH
ncbi:hypothetical protein TWF718_004110 [Orbilia javanica]|uniref:Uncharacterized protein n=1 Tax=Orbilia javanica TaxID=47235 RepID=A0AAN8MUI5_9PEZI